MVTFNGDDRVILCDDDTYELDVRKMYSMWKEWLQDSDNMKYLKAFEVVGGQPTTGDNIITPYFFLSNGWKVKPHEENHTLKVTGILLTNDESDPILDTDGEYRIAIQMIVPIYTETVKIGSGLSNEENNQLMKVLSTKIDVINASQY